MYIPILTITLIILSLLLISQIDVTEHNINGTNNLTVTKYLYGCTYYQYFGYHCDPISNEFESYAVLANYSKVASATREPPYAEAKFGKGLNSTGAHTLESLRANIIDPYKANKFSVYLSFIPENYESLIGNPYASLVSYKNGIFKQDPNNAGWEIELVPNNNTHTKKVRFTVYNTNGTPISPDDVDIPIGKFSEIVGTFDGKKVQIFINGILKSEIRFVGFYSGLVTPKNFLKIAGDAYCSCYLANGIIDEVRYYNYTLGSEKIRMINSPNDVVGKGLVGYWKLDGDLKDYSRFNNRMFYNTLIASMAFSPDGRLFYTEKNSGNIRILINDTVLDKPFASIPDVHVNWEQGLLGLSIDSRFKENHFIYVYYNYKDKNNGNIYARIVRLTDLNNEGTDKTVILDRIPASSTGFHTGGALSFNKVDDKLYATIGDAIDAKTAQDKSSLNGKTLRINRDGTIPHDNPFPNSPVYTFGHRNMFGIAFDERGNGIVTEPGSALYDEINSQIKGGNYGWRTMQPANKPPDPLANDSSIKPLRSYYIAENPTQATYYNDDRYPELKGKFIVGSFRGDLYAYKISEDGKKLLAEIKIITSIYPSKEVVGTAVSPNGDIYFGAYDIFRLNKIDLSSKIEMIIPIQINATNVNVSNVNYSEQTKVIEVSLTNRHGLSTFSVKIPQSIIRYISESHRCQSIDDTSNNQLPEVEVPYEVGIQRYENYSIITAELQADVPENLLFTINGATSNSSLVNVCLIENGNKK